jgi:hypothetical protein
MKKIVGCCAIACAIVFAGFTVPAEAQYAYALDADGDARRCISVSDREIQNGCNIAVSVLWCVNANNGCANGFKNSWTIPAGGRIGHGGPRGASITYGSCGKPWRIVDEGDTDYSCSR